MRYTIAVLLLVSVAAKAARAQECPPCPAPSPPPPPPTWILSVGAGLTHTGGNSDTGSYNATANALYDPPGKNAVRAEVLYLRASESDEAIVDRTLAVLRDEYTMSGRLFAFGEVGYQSDRFKEVDYLIAPLVGVGYKVIERPAALFSVDAGVGGALEKLEGRESNSDFAVKAGERAEWKMSPTASFFQKGAALWKARDFGDAYYRFEAGVAAALTKRLELKVTFADDYKTRPARPELVKNDTSFILSLLFKP
jgi:putative salt-induced outer membrane protein YdiY